MADRNAWHVRVEEIDAVEQIESTPDGETEPEEPILVKTGALRHLIREQDDGITQLLMFNPLFAQDDVEHQH